MQNGQGWSESGPDHTGVVDLEATVEFLLSLDADVLFLQEVEAGHDGGVQEAPPPNFTRLRKALRGYDGFFAYPPVNPDELPFGLGLAVFSRRRLESRRVVELPAADLDFEFGGRRRMVSKRSLIEAVCVFDGNAVRLMNTHLQAYFMLDATSNEYPEQREAVLRELRASDLPTLLGGDFNCGPGEDTAELFGRAGFPPVQTTEPTWRRRPYVLDHLFHSPQFTPRAARVIPTLCSDHHAVRAEFHMP